MLRARTGARNRQCRAQAEQAAGASRKRVTAPRQRGAQREHDAAVDAFSQPARGKLQDGHRARVTRAKDRERGISQTEFGLPDRQQHIDQIAVAVVQRMRRSRKDERAPGFGQIYCAVDRVAGAEIFGIAPAHQGSPVQPSRTTSISTSVIIVRAAKPISSGAR